MSKEARKKSGSLMSKLRANPWIIATVVLAVILLAFLIVNGGVTGNAVSGEEAGEKLVSFIEAQEQEAEIVSVERNGALYDVVVDVNGEEVGVYVTLDGEFLVLEPIPLSGSNVPSSVGEDWSVFENSLPSTIRGQILSFVYKTPEVYKGDIMEFKNYPEIPNTLIVFYHEGCGWCKEYYPVLVEAQNSYPDVTIYALDLGENNDVAGRYGVRGTPSNVINGKYYVGGYMPIEELSNVLDDLMA